MIRKFTLIIKMIAANWITLLYFEIIYKTLGFTLVIPFIQYLLGLLPGLMGVTHIGQENVPALLENPAAFLLAAVILILTALYVTCEITAFMILNEKGWQRENISLFRLLKQALQRTASLLKPSRIGGFSMLLILMFSVFSPVSVYLKSIRVPEFILEFVRGHMALYGIYMAVLVWFHILLLLYLFGLPAMLFEDLSFPGSWRASLRLLKGRKTEAASAVIGLTGLFISLILGLAALFVLVLGCYIKLRFPWEGEQRLTLYLSRGLGVCNIMGSTLTAAFLCEIIIFLYHQYRGEPWKERIKRRAGVRQVLIRAASAVVLVNALLVFDETEIGGGMSVPSYPDVEIIAHRAGAHFAPENTLAALDRAVGQGADGVEVDVQQLGDGTLILLHDTNFKRTTGVNLDVRDADYEAVRELDAGAYYDRATDWEKVPTLEEFLDRARGRIKVMLELKTSGHEKGIEKQVLDMIETCGMENHCMIASMDLELLRRVKQLAPDMETVYITMLLISSQYDLEYVDSYSVETTSLSRDLVFQAHIRGKKIYGWTANTDHSIKKVLRCNGDGLITDNPAYTEYFVESYGDSLLVEDIVKLFYGDNLNEDNME